jgi:hypothetical protein
MIPSAGSEVAEKDRLVMENRLVNEMPDRANLEALHGSSRNHSKAIALHMVTPATTRHNRKTQNRLKFPQRDPEMPKAGH